MEINVPENIVFSVELCSTDWKNSNDWESNNIRFSAV